MKLFTKKEQQELTVDEIAQAVQAAQAKDAQAEDAQPESVQTEEVKAVPSSHKIPLTHRTSAKVIAFLLAILMALVSVASAAGAFIMVEEELYTTSEWNYKNEAMRNIAEGDIQVLIHYLTSENKKAGDDDAMHYLSDRNIASIEMAFSEGPRKSWTYDGGMKESATEYSAVWYHMKEKGGVENWYSLYSNHGYDVEQIGTVEATIRLADDLTQPDTYYFADRLITIAYNLRYAVYAIGVVALISAILWFVFLMCASGRRDGLPEPQPGWGTKVPLDLLTAGTGLAVFLVLQLIFEAYYLSTLAHLGLAILGGVGIVVMALGWCMSFATRIKLGNWWRNTVIYFVLRILWRALRCLGRGMRKLGAGILTMLRGIPLVRQAIYLYLCFVIAEGLLLSVAYAAFYDEGIIVVIWTLVRIVLLPVVILYALMLRKLQKGGEALAAGDLSYQVDTARMLWNYKEHGENLNRIGEGMTAAVEQRLKSERMKTELITNVSHDIKTPLTSIINYADLIEKEQCENPTITEYSAVLHRQSERLKRLIDDLVEASKASTGNLEVLLAPCEVGVLLTQTAGEYEQRLAEKELSLITSQPEHPVKILADGRRLWRVFDNLMNNICKYAQRGTRVYLTLEEQDGQAVISFKNISHEPLNLSTDELLERFVQGDSARKSDGNGLGLSIAKSLTELQNGSLELMTDGDLFKVVLRFPMIN
ncbi:MAG: sensor histidine kinase [Oscillospiraceae bacterium]|nr:sensor histidine kinase [Oscillospiraceae bacterium]